MVVLVVTDPLRGAGRTHPLRGRAVTVSDSCANLVQTRSVAGCQLLINQWIRGVNQDSAKFIKNQILQSCIAFCATTDVVEKKMSDLVRTRASAALMCSLGQTAERCAS